MPWHYTLLPVCSPHSCCYCALGPVPGSFPLACALVARSYLASRQLPAPAACMGRVDPGSRHARQWRLRLCRIWACAPQDTLGAEQLSWFLNDIARINRTQTPWIIAAWHAPVVRA